MIPKYLRHGIAGMKPLARYLATGRDGKSQARVEWMSYRNLDPDMPWEVAAGVMTAIARQAPKRSCQDPTLHFIWSPSPYDKPLSQDQWEEIADRTLQRMGLDGHATLIVEHNDAKYNEQPRPHLHMMAVAVREDGRAWRTQSKRNPKHWGAGDYKWKSKLDELAREFELDYGLIQLDTPLTAYREKREWHKARSITRVEQEINLRSGRQPDIPMDPAKVKELSAFAKPIFKDAKSWEGLQQTLSDDLGYQLKPKGNGLILSGEGGNYAKLSAIGKVKLAGQDRAERLNKDRLGRALGESWDDYWTRTGEEVLAKAVRLKSETSLTPPGREPVQNDSDQSSTGDADSSSARRQSDLSPQGGGAEEIGSSRPPDVTLVSTSQPIQQPALDNPDHNQAGEDLGDALPALNQFSAEELNDYRGKMAAPLARARSWERIERIARDNGLRLHGGWAMHDGAQYLNIASIDGLDAKKRRLRCGETYGVFRQRRAMGLTKKEFSERLRSGPRPFDQDKDDEQEI